MNADDARETLNKITAKANKRTEILFKRYRKRKPLLLAKAHRKIKKAAKRGYEWTLVRYHGPYEAQFIKAVVARGGLREEGYEVTWCDEGDDYDLCVSWERKEAKNTEVYE